MNQLTYITYKTTTGSDEMQLLVYFERKLSINLLGGKTVE